MHYFRMCQEFGHQDEQVSHICIWQRCDQNIFLCVICLKNDIHIHGQKNFEHIITFNQFKELSIQKQGLINDYNHQREQLIKRYKNIEEELSSSLIKQLKEQRDFQEISYLINKVKTSIFIDIERESVKQILFIQDEIYPQIIFLAQVKEYFQIKGEKLSKKVQYELNGKNDLIQQNIQMAQQKKKDNPQAKQIRKEKIQQNGKFKQLKRRDYDIFYEHISDLEINTVVISPDENLLVYGGQNKKLTIIDLQTGEEIKQISTQSSITVCGFTQGTNKLFVGDQQGHLYYFDHNFNLYKKHVHKGEIKGMSLIEDRHILSFCGKNYIRLSDLQGNQIQIVKHQSKYELICVEYKRFNHHNFFICCTQGNDINFYLADNGQLVFHQDNIHDELCVQQLLPIRSRNFLTANIYQIIIWNVSKEINKLHKVIQLQINLILNVSLVKGRDNIMIITQDSIELFDLQKQKQQQLIKISQENLTSLNSLKQIQQVDSVNYIITFQQSNYFKKILGQIRILKKQE